MELAKTWPASDLASEGAFLVFSFAIPIYIINTYFIYFMYRYIYFIFLERSSYFAAHANPFACPTIFLLYILHNLQIVMLYFSHIHFASTIPACLPACLPGSSSPLEAFLFSTFAAPISMLRAFTIACPWHASKSRTALPGHTIIRHGDTLTQK